jgi:spoIIIJ-associated protein
MPRMEQPMGDESAAPDEAFEELPADPGERALDLIDRVVDEMDLDAEVELEETDEEIRVTVKGDDVGLLIGKHGSTIDALQHLAIRVAYLMHDGDRKSVVVDAAGYRERREATLRRAADQAVTEALREGRAVELEPMGAYERRTVHTYLRDRTDIQTHSEGDEPERRLVVTPVTGASE